MIPRKRLLKQFGITRKTLDHYNDIKLLCPVNIDEIESGKQLGFKPEWQYDDDAMNKLQLIQIFRALDYEPAEIKGFYEKSESILDNAMDKLIAKQKEIEGMINIVKMMQSVSNLPESLVNSIEGINLEYIWGEKPYNDQIEELKEVLSGSDLYEDEQAKWAIPMIQIMFLIIGFKDKGPNSEEVQNLLWETYQYFIDIMLEEEDDQELYEHREELLEEKEPLEAFYNMTSLIISDALKDEIISKYGEEIYSFMISSIEVFKAEHLG